MRSSPDAGRRRTVVRLPMLGVGDVRTARGSVGCRGPSKAIAMRPCARKDEGAAMRDHSRSPDRPTVIGTQGLAGRRLWRYLVLAGVGWLAMAALLDVTRPAAAAPARRSGGVGVSTVSVVDFSEAAKSPDARTPPPPTLREEEFHRRARPRLPSRPTSGARKVPPRAGAPTVAPAISSSFDGLSEACPGCGVPPDPNAATSASVSR